MAVLDLVLGRPLASSEGKKESLSIWTGVPVLGLDALASTGYGPEAALTVLLPLGTAAFRYYPIITVAIVVKLATLYFSYRQTAEAYPNGGGAFIVAKDNFGQEAGLWAAVSLMLDYLLNVAVGIAAGVGAIVSAIPALQPYLLTLCLLVLMTLTIVNLRGVRESGLVFVGPVLVFVTCLTIVLVRHWLRGRGHDGRVRMHLFYNALGAVTTGAVLLIILLAKFVEGAWITVAIMAILVLLLHKIHRHYVHIDRMLEQLPKRTIAYDRRAIAVVPISGCNRLMHKALQVATLFADEIYAVYVRKEQEDIEPLKRRWVHDVENAGQLAATVRARLEILDSPYRDVDHPVLTFLNRVERDFPARMIAVVLPELVEPHWYDYLLRSRQAAEINKRLKARQDERIVIVTCPSYVHDHTSRK